MKMKKACEATALTEKAIRLYLAKGLLRPQKKEGTIDFSAEEIERLREIALLRRLDFSIEQIAAMLRDPAAIPGELRVRRERARAEAERERGVLAVLDGLGTVPESVSALVGRIRERNVGLPGPDFGRFDELSEEQRRREREEAFEGLEKSGRRKQKALLWAGTGDMVTIQINDESTAELLGRGEISVPCRVYGVDPQAGDALVGCHLAVSLTNFELMRLGVNPLQTMRTQSAEINREWTRFVLQRLFDGGGSAMLCRAYETTERWRPLLTEPQ
ncbi:MAG: MerR family transcriptional regulator [Eubacteriales bacterium]|nr:MerR family transcriptional regulator [Eubacteriales bacterium]